MQSIFTNVARHNTTKQQVLYNCFCGELSNPHKNCKRPWPNSIYMSSLNRTFPSTAPITAFQQTSDIATSSSSRRRWPFIQTFPVFLEGNWVGREVQPFLASPVFPLRSKEASCSPRHRWCPRRTPSPPFLCKSFRTTARHLSATKRKIKKASSVSSTF